MSVEEELQGGIKNALERGIPLQKVCQTFINAGYSIQTVQSAARLVTEGATTIAPPYVSGHLSDTPELPKPISSTVPGQTAQVVPDVPKPYSAYAQEQPKKSASNLKVILLVIVLLLLIGTLVVSLMFKEQFLALLI